MAGFWERVVKSEDGDRANIHMVVAGFKAYFANSVDDEVGIVADELIDLINSDLRVPLNAEELIDLSKITDAIDDINNVSKKTAYLMVIEYAMVAGENGFIDESKWRNDLGL